MRENFKLKNAYLEMEKEYAGEVLRCMAAEKALDLTILERDIARYEKNKPSSD